MVKYTIRRLLLIVPILLFVILIVFYIMSITPGDPARIILGKDAPQEAIDALQEKLGLNKPFFRRYIDYIGGVLRFDFGEGYRSGKPVFQEILPKFPTTLRLAVLSVILSTLLGIPIGLLSAAKKHSALDMTVTVSALVLASIPGFWLSLLQILVFSLLLGILPSNGIGSFSHYIMPTLTISLPAAAVLSRMTRAQMLEVMRQDYIRTARSKGADNTRIIWKHALRNTLMPVITAVGMSFAGMLGGTMIIEIVFGLPGIGNVIVTAIRMKDAPVVMASTIFLSTLFMIIMLIVDLLYAYINPVIRAKFRKR